MYSGTLYNKHHWDQQTDPFNTGVLCWGVIYDIIKYQNGTRSVPCSEVSLMKGSTDHCTCIYVYNIIMHTLYTIAEDGYTVHIITAFSHHSGFSKVKPFFFEYFQDRAFSLIVSSSPYTSVLLPRHSNLVIILLS